MFTTCGLCNRPTDSGDLDAGGVCSECYPARARITALRAQLAATEEENERLREECNGWSNRVASILSRVKDMHPTFGDLNRWEEEYEAKVQVRIAAALRARPDDGRVVRVAASDALAVANQKLSVMGAATATEAKPCQNCSGQGMVNQVTWRSDGTGKEDDGKEVKP